MRINGQNTVKDFDSTSNEPNLISVAEIQSQGENQPHENRPPYYALCFIMKS